MAEIDISKDGKAGRITLQRPKSLNALTHSMCLAIEEALDKWKLDHDVKFVIIEGEGTRAFCSGGDITEMYRAGLRRDYTYGRNYWRDEYRLNAKIAQWAKPIITFLHGFTMGGGVGIGCHGSHRIVGESSRIAMPECTIGLVPDVGGSLLLAQAPGRVGEFLGLTGTRMGPFEAIYAGFADYFCSENLWNEIKNDLCNSGSLTSIENLTQSCENNRLFDQLNTINQIFSGRDVDHILEKLQSVATDFSSQCLKKMNSNSPLSMCCALELIHRQRETQDIRDALSLEFRFTYRSAEFGDFLEGIRARVIDKGSQPLWKHKNVVDVSSNEIDRMLAPLRNQELVWETA